MAILEEASFHGRFPRSLCFRAAELGLASPWRPLGGHDPLLQDPNSQISQTKDHWLLSRGCLPHTPRIPTAPSWVKPGPSELALPCHHREWQEAGSFLVLRVPSPHKDSHNVPLPLPQTQVMLT